ncbi:TPA: DUF4145 domain-containing protein [Streptococcus suis]|uniref:DUF4145 domain-containing protein n=2 Tax=Streptococcus suis TaxID=1307 RepID=UPI000F63D722|nr:DUF4145 domain-containing protein [Streptococcus suis]RRR45598.1 DUF4145 domain-containing protein [Streptococcus suis]RRR60067.1 DUF4145 domain-containing protein [Streptococcus suis]HEM3384958.1 DUF4145 domain-containing protein [Streptococcus suis]
MRKVSIDFLSGSSKIIKIQDPEHCPHCGRVMSPRLVSKSSSEDEYSSSFGSFALTFRCSYSDCKKYFSVEYVHNYNRGICLATEYSYRPPIKVSLPKNVEKVSPMFVEIYGQASIAESEKLEQIAGVGYRKSAEFLIKDYAIRKSSDKEEEIKKMPLGQVISTYLVDFPKVQTLAKAVTWIGNDETHYIRKHDDKDIQDLKNFILATAQFIAADYDVESALEFTSSN